MSSKLKSEVEDDMKESDVLEDEEIESEALSDEVRDSSEEEQALEEVLVHSGQYQRKMDATQIYLSEIGFSPLLTAEQEIFYSRRALKGDAAARKRMIESNLRLVVKIARRYCNRGLALLVG